MSVGTALVPGAFFGRPRFAASHRARCAGVRGRSFSGVILRASRSNASKSFSSVFFFACIVISELFVFDGLRKRVRNIAQYVFSLFGADAVLFDVLAIHVITREDHDYTI
jgi:hypothetical protein